MTEAFDPERAMQEILDRVRRTETRVTKVANHFGVESGVQRPTFRGGKVQVTSRKVSLDELMTIVPPDYKGTVVDVMCNGDLLATLTVER